MALPTELKQRLSEFVDTVVFDTKPASDVIRFSFNDKTIKIRYTYFMDVEGKRQLVIYLQER